MRPCSTHLRAERGGGVQWVDVKVENVLPTKATHARMLYTAIYYAVYIRTYVCTYITSSLNALPLPRRMSSPRSQQRY